MKKLALFIILISIVLTSCVNNKNAKKDEFVINGYFKSGEGIKIFLDEVTPIKSILTDSIKADLKGVFNFRHKINETGLYDIKINNKNFVRLLIEPGETIDLTGDAKSLIKTYTVRGSHGSELLKQLNERYYNTTADLDSIVKIFRNSKHKPEFQNIKNQLDTNYNNILKNHKIFLEDFIKANMNSISSIVAIYQKLGRSVFFDKNNTKDFQLFKSLDSALILKYPENKHVVEFHKSISEFIRTEIENKLAKQMLEVGSIPPEIKLPDPDGTIITLSSLKGKVVLLDFWASWCKPCRVENKELVKLYNKYKNKGFEIYSVSLDKDKDSWLSGIKEDKINWIQVSDLKYWSSPMVGIYNIEAIPYSMLLDKDGKIIAKGKQAKDLEIILKSKL